MRSLAGSGLRAAAIKHFEQIRSLLERELGVLPEPETDLLYEQIRWGGLAPSEPVRTAPLSQVASPERVIQVRSQLAFVGRKRELSLLQSRFHETLNGNGQIVLVAGEAGWGKTALIDAFTHLIRAARPNVIPAYGKGNAYTGIGDPYLPFREILGFSQRPTWKPAGPPARSPKIWFTVCEAASGGGAGDFGGWARPSLTSSFPVRRSCSASKRCLLISDSRNRIGWNICGSGGALRCADSSPTPCHPEGPI